jgi:hypothetical protein
VHRALSSPGSVFGSGPGSGVAAAGASGSGHHENDDDNESLFLAEGLARVPALPVSGSGSSRAGGDGNDDDGDDDTTRPGAFTAINRPSGSGSAGRTGPCIYDTDLEGPPPLSHRSGTHAALSGHGSLSGPL